MKRPTDRCDEDALLTFIIQEDMLMIYPNGKFGCKGIFFSNYVNAYIDYICTRQKGYNSGIFDTAAIDRIKNIFPEDFI